jgi:hypothetical protein
VASLLAPDDGDQYSGTRKLPRRLQVVGQAYLSSGEEDGAEEDIDVVTSDQDAEGKERNAEQQAEESTRLHQQQQQQQDQDNSASLQPPFLSAWGQQPQHPAAALALHQSVMFPGSSLVSTMEQQLVSRYYEQLAQQHRLLQQQQQQAAASLAESASDS